MTKIFLIRHGETSVKDKIPGRTPGVYLNEKGKQQAENLAKRLAPVHLDAIFCSPLDRTIETALPLASSKGIKIEERESLAEVDYGDWTLKTFAELNQLGEWKLYNTMRSNALIPNGEMFIEIQSRMIKEIKDITTKYPDGSVAVFSHGDPIKTVIAYYAGMPLDLLPRLTIYFASISLITIGSGHIQINFINNENELFLI
ncbi:MAG TPA: histidine phosphatase family protein [Ignavibacteriales bacterium]|nr:histidine phosphatase family protein [Ignavibacteriales bacterium]